MKSVYKKVSVIALSSMIIAGGIASSGINAQAYSPKLSGQIQELSGHGKRVYNKAREVVEKAGASIEAVFGSSEAMNRYVNANYWDKVQIKNKNAKKYRKDLLKYVDCGNNFKKLESVIKERPLGDVFRVKYGRHIFLIRRKYNKLSEIPSISGRDIEELSRGNQKLYQQHIKEVVKKAGYEVIQIGDKNQENDKKMQDYIKERYKDGVFNDSNSIEEDLLVGIGCIDFGSIKFNLEHRNAKPVMRLNHSGIDMLLVRK